MNKNYIYVGIVVVVIIIGFLLIQNSKAKSDLAAAQAAAAAHPAISGPAWLQALNSPAIASLLGGFASGIGSNVSSGSSTTKG